MRFHVGSDHGGVMLLDVLVAELAQWGLPVLSRSGPAVASERVDYPNIAVQVCQRVLQDRQGQAADVFGLLVCGTGQGMAMTANKIPGIRAGVVADVFSAQMVRAHNNANVLCLGERVTGVGLAKLLLRGFIDATFEGGRHLNRVELIGSLTRPVGEGS
ncbi:Ribose 5-phosphate isomerase B [Enhygromyxa salina]|uniref:Ribose 5-phosphate isomerase B n=1 Tax=Enhygromyxa salina TaxID=215803 RepID=A0A0C1ZL02_9BACT|nr:ribose 5-phosphate isomerase B [Enhygromyxa salina]KIG18194.1 Ribose 5-phosphate isomerase B [Enhygromyxa salina]